MKSKKKDSKISKKKTKKPEERKIETELEKEIREAEKVIAGEKEIEHAESEEFFDEPIRQLSISQEASAPVLERIIQNQIPSEIPIEAEQREAKMNNPEPTAPRMLRIGIELKIELNVDAPLNKKIDAITERAANT